MTRHLALVVDDEPDIRELLELTLSRMNVDTRSAENLSRARALLVEQTFDLCLTDMRLPDGNGIELVAHIQARYPRMPVAVITAHGNMESAVSALKAGAYDFVSKPVDLQMLRRLVSTALKLADRPTVDGTDAAIRLLGVSDAIQKTRATIEKLARSQTPVYISGESGAGKELAARLIHDQGPRSDKPFIPVNCGAIPEHLMESEFFGHRKGSFTGAVTDKQGLFQAAHEGTLFLDEIADLPLHMQVKLLRAIQEKAVRPVGSQTEVAIDVRILSATHKILDTLVKEGAFRQDLFYRINVIELHVPSLRERIDDIPVLAQYILNRLAGQANGPPAMLSREAINALQAYSFPGNVRELENILERAVTLCENHWITTEDLQLPDVREVSGMRTDGELALDPFLDSMEKETLLEALKKTRYNKTAAAKLLGISFGALRYRLKKLGLD
ncbi:MAG: putative two-component response regulator [Gammaproteobacteria bacterium]|nr:MAG: putative two-component response regulator [Gammaproteobacteria bacterium]TND03654.1 MAG: putative two-component response regulator [Gammaproteobacteria bacterium]